MRHSLMLLVVVLGCALFAANARAQAPAEPPTYTFIIERTIPRAMWEDWEKFAQEKYRPVLEKLMADGTIVSWGLFATVVHVDGSPTHGSWMEAPSIESMHKALAELGKLPNPIMASPNVTHRDRWLHSQVRHARTSSGSNAFLWINNTHVQIGKGDQYRELFVNFLKPIADDLVSKGTMSMFALTNETIHTADPYQVFYFYLFSGPDGQDKFYAGLNDMEKKNAFFADAVNATEVEAPHRDYLARVTAYAIK
jgi:hypothetical protein